MPKSKSLLLFALAIYTFGSQAGVVQSRRAGSGWFKIQKPLAMSKWKSKMRKTNTWWGFKAVLNLTSLSALSVSL